jgi:acyl transferase domain-containing protein
MKLAGGVSSFGYAGTIAHTVLSHKMANDEHIAIHVNHRHAFLWRELPHPFVHLRLPSSDEANVFCSPAAAVLHILVANHVVQGRVIFPGAGYLEVARAAGATALRDVYFLQPLAAEVPGLLIGCAVSNGRFEVRTSDSAAFDDATVHCSGATAADAGWQRVDHSSRRTLSRAADVGALYDGFDAVGLQYGPGYRTLVNVWGGESYALARLHTRSTHEGTQVHPADLDDALCTSATMASSGGSETRLPFAVEDALLQSAMGELWAVRSRVLHGPHDH